MYSRKLVSAVWRFPILQYSVRITKTCLYNFDPLKPHFYIIKLRFTLVYIIFLISIQNIDCRYSLEPPQWGGSNEYLQSMFWGETWKYQRFLSENFGIHYFSYFYSKHTLQVLVRTASIYVLRRNMKISAFFIWKFSFLVVNFSVFLNRHVFVMVIFSCHLWPLRYAYYWWGSSVQTSYRPWKNSAVFLFEYVHYFKNIFHFYQKIVSFECRIAVTCDFDRWL